MNIVIKNNIWHRKKNYLAQKTISSAMGVEPTNVWSGVQHTNHWATVVVKFLIASKAYM